jgi:hypothetical protein
MERRDITGKKYYKELSIKPIKQNIAHHCFIGIRTKLEPLDFFSSIFLQTNYLFQLSKSSLEMLVKNDRFSFCLFEYQDTLSEHIVFCIVNKSMCQEQYLFGKEEKNACFVLHRKYWKRMNNQLSLSFEEDKEEDKIEEEIDKEQKEWDLFKTTMKKNSVNSAGNIDYLFPVEIRTYEILKPLFMYLSNMMFCNYTLINPRDITNIDFFFPQWYAYKEQSNPATDVIL